MKYRFLKYTEQYHKEHRRVYGKPDYRDGVHVTIYRRSRRGVTKFGFRSIGGWMWHDHFGFTSERAALLAACKFFNAKAVRSKVEGTT